MKNKQLELKEEMYVRKEEVKELIEKFGGRIFQIEHESERKGEPKK